MAIYSKGADQVALRAAGQRLDTMARELDAVRWETDHAVQRIRAAWRGADLERFHTQWSSAQSSLSDAATRVSAMGQTLTRNADQQTAASSGNGTGIPLPGAAGIPLFGPLSRNHPVNPDSPAGMGPSKPIGKVPMDDADMQYNDVKQGQLGDCWLASTLAVVGKNDPQFIRDHIKYDASANTYTVTLYDGRGNSVNITVDATAPAGAMRNPDESFNWMTVYEKAFASYAGSYAELDGGHPYDAMRIMTGRQAEAQNDMPLSTIEEGLKNGKVYVANSENGSTWWPFDSEVDKPQVVGNHSYIVDTVEMRDGERKIHLINPWGGSGHVAGDPNLKLGDLWLTEQEFRDNFGRTDTIQGKRP